MTQADLNTLHEVGGLVFTHGLESLLLHLALELRRNAEEVDVSTDQRNDPSKDREDGRGGGHLD